jgi:hypothetical protein
MIRSVVQAASAIQERVEELKIKELKTKRG